MNVFTQRRKRLARRGIGVYLTTGTETEALRLNPGPVVKAARKRRRELVKERERLSYDQGFSAWCECPHCGIGDIHRFWAGKKPRIDGGVTRVCASCGHMWQQRA